MKPEAEISLIGFVISIVMMSAFLASAGLSSPSGETEILFISSLLMWISYLAAHKLSEGTLVDGKDSGEKEHMRPEKKTEYTGGIIGALILSLGLGIGAAGIKTFNPPTTFAGALLFNTGYVVAHLSTTGELL